MKKKILVQRRLDYRDQSAVANRRLAIIVILGLVFFVGMIAGVKVDAYAEAVSMQAVNKASWAVAYSKANGDYPF